MPPTDSFDPAELLPGALASAEEACDLIKKMMQRPLESWSKQDRSPVTAIDLAVDALLRRSLGALAPDISWMSEETADDPSRLNARRLWVVDPIDGTRALMSGLPEYCISVALVADHRPVLAIIANPSTGDLYRAVVGEGAWHNSGRRLQVAKRSTASAPRLLVSRSEHGRGMWQGVAEDMTIEPLSGLAWKMVQVADGLADATVTPWRRSEWDAAAGDLIVAEAGGWSADLAGNPLSYNQRSPTFRGVICASGDATAAARALAEELEQQRGRLSMLWRRPR